MTVTWQSHDTLVPPSDEHIVPWDVTELRGVAVWVIFGYGTTINDHTYKHCPLSFLLAM